MSRSLVTCFGTATGSSAMSLRKDVKCMGIQEVLSAPRSPWQRAYVERVIGTLRRECLDHVIVLNEASLYRHVKSFLAYYHESRTHLSLAKDPPEPRPVHPLERRRRSCHTASWRSSPPLRAARSLNVAVLGAIPIQGQVCRFSLPDKTRLPLFAKSQRRFLVLHPLLLAKRGSEHLICSRYAPAASGCRWDLR